MPAVVGAGSWGTALANVLARASKTRGSVEPVKLWARDPALVESMKRDRRNAKYLPHVQLLANVEPTSSLKEALDGASTVVHAVPSKATRAMAHEYGPLLARDAVVVSATKGLERGSYLRMSEVIAEESGRPCAAISGPNHAEEVGAGQPTAAVIAFPDMSVATPLAQQFSTPVFKAYPRRDILGTEICGAYKNVVALAGGMAAGLGWGDNCAAALVTLGVDEMADLARYLGGDERTVTGLAGIGDLVATATSKHSRNRSYGEQLALGSTMADIEKKMNGMVAEGVFAVRAFEDYANSEKMDLPLTHTVYRIVHEGLPVPKGVELLLSKV